ncbi:unnamed protein product [Bemisia tabaci]|uniref:Dynein heavy chain tail domain-containing protein n=2 Tax=Bemisia tabaci TaxID=7038 RepID=A0A9P0AKQ3_BEMTA|nr:unnamed protein product [Bemisia tabaci]
MSQLCRALSNQVIISCRNLIDLSILFEGRTRSSMKIFQECIRCCSTYKSMYNKVKLTNDRTGDSQWNSDLKIILNSVDTFMERCQEMIELCETMLIYGRLDETQDVPKPTFGFTRGAEFEKVCDKIEDLFHESFSKVEQVQDCILDVQSSDWYREMNRFRKDMKKIDTIAENLILESFNMVKNVEEGLLTLQSLYEYSKRPSLFNVIEKKTAMVYKMFWDELQEAKLSLLSEKNSYARLMPKYAGRAWTSLVKKTQLKSLYDLFQEKLWLPKVTIAVEIESLYQDVIQTFDEAILSNYKRWLEVAESKIGVRLKRSLICRSLQKPGLLEVNIDRKLLYVFSEAKLWVDMGFPIPNEMSQLVARRNELTLLYR